MHYQPAHRTNTHYVLFGYVAWLFGIFGAHRFYFGKPVSGVIWCLTGGLLGIGWLVDLVLIPSMDHEASDRFRGGTVDYTVAWVLFVFLGVFGVHRMYIGKWGTGILYLLTFGLCGIGWIHDLLTLNRQISEMNAAY